MSISNFLTKLCSIIAILATILSSPAGAQINAIGIGQQNFKNTSGAAADDFHATFQVPTIGLGQDVATATKYPFATGTSTTQNFNLAPPVGNNQNFQLTYSPGGLPFFFNNLVSGNFTLGGVPVATTTVPIFDLFSFVPGSTPSSVVASTQLSSGPSLGITVSGLAAVTNIPGSFFTLDDFASSAALAQGTPVSVPAGLTLPAGSSGPVLSLGAVELGTFALVTGAVSPQGDAGVSLPFAFAALPQAVPEPLSLTLVGAGLTCLGLLRCRRAV